MAGTVARCCLTCQPAGAFWKEGADHERYQRPASATPAGRVSAAWPCVLDRPSVILSRGRSGRQTSVSGWGAGGSWNSLPPGPDTTVVTDIYDCSCSPE